ncbi:hypothetical protein OA93_14990 [Flavobacterium sp. KMS]|uniref:hypothetical protein n=1 Tax=Flavobacterium sp. KMS TaxID=1566023 RepID=UPI00057DC066|nr:hypothetical protein [Flavobacterium sp. KMS]KIA97238.1 hypothetical protein OA93_14990 [Flavobacterium sp. KMS]
MSRIRIVGGTIAKTTGGDHNIYSDGNIVYNSGKAITETSDVGIMYGEPKSPPKKEIIVSAFKFESTYVHDHLLSVAKEMTPKFNADDTSIICKFYKAVNDGKITNIPIEVSKNLHPSKVFYDLEEKKIIIWETSLLGVEKSDDQKIKLLQDLTQSYSTYLKECLKDMNSGDSFESYDYDLFRFDAIGSENVVIGKLETPTYKGNLDLSFVEVENKAPKKYDWKPEKDPRAHGPNAGNGGDGGDFYGGPGDPPTKSPNIGFKFSYSLNGGFTASVYVGISKSVSSGNFGAMGSLNTALTYYGKGSVGTSRMSPTLVTLSATPSITLGYKTGNALQMNLFNQHAGSGVYNPYEYGFTLGTTGILSSGSVSREFNPETGEFEKNPYNSHDVARGKDKDGIFGNTQRYNNTRNQIVGGAAIKVGNFMIASYNDIYKPPLFFGMGSDEYWSAGINMQAKLPQNIKMAYAVDMYYGKSNNKNPYSQDKIIDKQNYDYQQLFDVLLNRGQETFSITDVNGNLKTETRFGYGTFWPTNAMHDSIAFPDVPKEPKKPIEPKNTLNIELNKKYNTNLKQYNIDLEIYNRDMINYKVSTQLKPKPTFHHLFVVYDKDNKEDLERLKKYLNAGQSEEGKLLKEMYILDNKK